MVKTAKTKKMFRFYNHSNSELLESQGPATRQLVGTSSETLLEIFAASVSPSIENISAEFGGTTRKMFKRNVLILPEKYTQHIIWLLLQSPFKNILGSSLPQKRFGFQGVAMTTGTTQPC